MLADVMAQPGMVTVARIFVLVGVLWLLSRRSVRRSLSSWVRGHRG